MHNKFGSTFSDLSKMPGDGCALNCKPAVSAFFVHSPILNWDVHFSCLVLSGNYSLLSWFQLG